MEADAIDKEQTSMMHLPESAGGFGLTSMSFIAVPAFAAHCDPEGDPQNVRVMMANDDLIASLSAETQNALEINSRPYASAWIRATEVLGNIEGYRTALQTRLRYNAFYKRKMCICRCGFSCAARDFDNHRQNCGKAGGVQSTHKTLDVALNEGLQQLAVQSTFSPVVCGKRRADREVYLGAGPVLVDVTSISPLCKSHKGKSREMLHKGIKTKKENHYPEAKGLVTFSIETTGGWGPSAVGFARRVVKDADGSLSAFVAVVSKKFACALGLCLLRGRSEQRLPTAAKRSQQQQLAANLIRRPQTHRDGVVAAAAGADIVLGSL